MISHTSKTNSRGDRHLLDKTATNAHVGLSADIIDTYLRRRLLPAKSSLTGPDEELPRKL
jgi:hypothetical protein